MAITNEVLIRDALGLLGVLTETQNASAEQATHGLRVLNELLAEWEQSGIDLQWFEQDTLAEECPLPPNSVSAVKYNLAIALAPYYTREIPSTIGVRAEQYYQTVLRDAVRARLVPADVSSLPMGSGSRGDYDVESGGF